MKPHLLLIFPHETATRDFFLHRFAEKLLAHYRVSVIGFIKPKEDLDTLFDEMGITYTWLPKKMWPLDTSASRIYQRLHGLLAWAERRNLGKKHQITTFLEMQETEKELAPKVFQRKYFLWKLLLRFPALIRAVRTFFNRRVLAPVGKMQALPESPDLVMVFDLFSPFHQGLIWHYTHHPVPVIGVVRSWDNLSAKGILHHKFDRYFVWNTHMEDELMRYYGIPREQIAITGALHYDFYHHLHQTSPAGARPAFLPKAGKVVSFLLAYPDLVPELYEHLAAIVRAKEAGRFVAPFDLVVRLQPGLRSKPVVEELKKYQGKIIIDPVQAAFFDQPARLWRQAAADFAHLIRCSSVVVNYISTTTIDAAIFDVPTITIAYDRKMDTHYYQSIVRYIDRTHYQYLKQGKGHTIAYDESALIDAINAYLTQEQASAQAERKAIIREMLNDTPGQTEVLMIREIGKFFSTESPQPIAQQAHS